MTEDEAKTKWCPFVRASWSAPAIEFHPSASGYIGNRDVNGDPSSPALQCIGSACMAWRKDGKAEVENRRGQWVDRDIDGTGRWRYHGYCGLAGKP